MATKNRRFSLKLFLFLTLASLSVAQGLPGEFEKLHYDLTSISRMDALSNTGYSYNCGIASSYLNPSLISDTSFARSRFGISYGFTYTRPVTYKPQASFYYDKSIHEYSFKKHHVTFTLPCLSQKRNLGGIGIDLDHINLLESITRFYPNRTGSISEKSNLLTIAYGLPFLTLNNFKNFIGLSAKVNFYNRTQDNPYPEILYDEMKEVRYLFDLSYSAYLFDGFHLSCLLRNIPLEKKAQYVLVKRPLNLDQALGCTFSNVFLSMLRISAITKLTISVLLLATRLFDRRY